MTKGCFMKITVCSLIIGFQLLVPLKVLAHGEDRLGPHQGFIQMPAAYHVELVIKNNELNIFLMDVNNKNPVTQNSSVELVLQNKDKRIVFDCLPSSDFFNCKTSLKVNFNSGKFILNSKREGKVGKEIFYNLPLKINSEVHH
jgi:hypothetical protein